MLNLKIIMIIILKFIKVIHLFILWLTHLISFLVCTYLETFRLLWIWTKIFTIRIESFYIFLRLVFNLLIFHIILVINTNFTSGYHRSLRSFGLLRFICSLLDCWLIIRIINLGGGQDYWIILDMLILCLFCAIENFAFNHIKFLNQLKYYSLK